MRMFAITMLLACVSNAGAVSLSGKPTDDTVCDLAPNTTHWLGQRTFVPARTPKLDAIYSRLAMHFIVETCRHGQTLILHSDDGSNLDARYFTLVGTTLCGAANLVREPAATAEETHAFRIRCRISRMGEARAWLNQVEARESTQEMLAAGPRSSTPPAPEADTAARQRERRCEQRMTFGAFTGVSGGCTK